MFPRTHVRKFGDVCSSTATPDIVFLISILQIRDDSNSNLEDLQFSFRNHHRNLSEFFDTRTDSPGAQIFPVVSWAYMLTMEDRVLIHVNSILGKYRDKRLQSPQAIPALSNILRACSRHIELLLEVQ